MENPWKIHGKSVVFHPWFLSPTFDHFLVFSGQDPHQPVTVAGDRIKPARWPPVLNKRTSLHLVSDSNVSSPYLIGGDWNMNFMNFHILGIIIPTDPYFFSEG